jgi:hypothetical protein
MMIMAMTTTTMMTMMMITRNTTIFWVKSVCFIFINLCGFRNVDTKHAVRYEIT